MVREILPLAVVGAMAESVRIQGELTIAALLCFEWPTGLLWFIVSVRLWARRLGSPFGLVGVGDSTW